MSWAKTEPVRLYVYAAMTPVLLLLVFLGVVDALAVPYIVAAGAAILGVGGAGVELARSRVYPAASVEDLLDEPQPVVTGPDYDGRHRV